MANSTERPPFDAEFDTLVAQSLEEWKVPGLSICVVHGPHTHSKAYGFAELPDKLMTTDASFQVGSLTKPLTAASMSMLIDDSKGTDSPIDWDTPLSSIIPDDFVLSDDYATQHITIEDALSLRSGLPDHLWKYILGPRDGTVKDHVRSLRHMPITAPPRTKFQYSSHMYVAVTHALQERTGETLGSFMKRRVWDPLGMNKTYFSVSEAEADSTNREKIVKGYICVPGQDLPSGSGQYFLASPPNFEAMTGAGAMVSNVLDYSHWIRELIERNGPLRDHDSLTKPRIIHFNSGDTSLPGPYHGYALGWVVENYRGETVYTHSGGMPGFASLVFFVPERHFGFVMMGNSGTAAHASMTLAIHLLDRLQGPSVDSRHQQKMKTYFGQLAGERSMRMSPKPDVSVLKPFIMPMLPDPPLPYVLPLEKYQGTYCHPADASFTITLDDDILVAHIPHSSVETQIVLTHASGEFFLGKLTAPALSDLPPLPMEFYVDHSGTVSKVGLTVEPSMGGDCIWFNRKES
ncbi:Peptidase S12 Pab87-related C-terminal [Penicillium angulare]|uniref:Peptidase S12 Pab87-related C-terminal n=1 Tax=Penicillium angulare TaxID=116970 RepID=UPI002541E758|nr:Peptidase S12 Pab87-related C-terminal [Penicillium angulare]KAJ5289033.1 Peptidase S12 Pab87-related C-terminal [Penicillium angulare]